MDKKVSIIIPIYNAEENLERCINSVLNQTYENIEVILINDGSTDSSGVICCRYMEKYKRIVYKVIENAGVSNARNVGLTLATGNFVYFMDSDDTIDLKHIEVLVKKMNNSVVAVNASINTINKNTVHRSSKNETITIEQYKNDFIINRYALRCWGWLLKAEIAKKISFDINTNYFEDSLYILEYLFFFRDGSICFTDEVYYNYYVNQESIVNSYKKVQKNIESVLYSIKKAEEIYSRNCTIRDEYKKCLLQREIYLIENISRNLRFRDYDMFFQNEKLKKELLEIRKVNNIFRYRLFIFIVLKNKRMFLLIYLKVRKISKKIKDLLKK